MWHSYSRRAAEGSVGEDVITAIAERREPPFKSGDDRAVYAYAKELLERHKVAGGTFQAAVKVVGKPGLVELTALIGNYSMVAMALNAFEVDLPSDAQLLPA